MSSEGAGRDNVAGQECGESPSSLISASFKICILQEKPVDAAPGRVPSQRGENALIACSLWVYFRSVDRVRISKLWNCKRCRQCVVQKSHQIFMQGLVFLGKVRRIPVLAAAQRQPVRLTGVEVSRE